MSKKLVVLGKECKAIEEYFKGTDVEITRFTRIDGAEAPEMFDLIALYDYDGPIPVFDRVINLHYSLLPAFNGKDEIKSAYLAGVKVSGVTVHYAGADNEKIIAQYPVLIGNTEHFDEFEAEIRNLGNVLYPIVIDKILKDEVFDFSDLIGGCGGCAKCH